MATRKWGPNAADVAETQTLTVAGTWIAGEIITLTVGTKDIVITVGSDLTPADIAEIIQLTWSGGALKNDELRTTTGDLEGEFSEIEATWAAATSVVNLTGPVGVAVTIAEGTSSVSGTIVLAITQAATGKNFWGDAGNWDTVPLEDDVMEFKDTDVSVLYGMPTTIAGLNVQEWATFTGDIGLPAINPGSDSQTGASVPYTEYRTRYMPCGGGGEMGIGNGPSGGYRFISLNEADAPPTVTINKTGAQKFAAHAAVTLVGLAPPADPPSPNVVKIRGGVVGIENDKAYTPAASSTPDLHISGGATVFIGANCIPNEINNLNGTVSTETDVSEITQDGGTLTVNGDILVATTSVIRGGRFKFNGGSVTGDPLTISAPGILDLSENTNPLLVMTGNVKRVGNAEIKDPGGLIISGGAGINFVGSTSLANVDLGSADFTVDLE